MYLENSMLLIAEWDISEVKVTWADASLVKAEGPC